MIYFIGGNGQEYGKTDTDLMGPELIDHLISFVPVGAEWDAYNMFGEWVTGSLPKRPT